MLAASLEKIRRRRRRQRPRVVVAVENIALGRDHRLRKQVQSLRDADYDVTVICPADPANYNSWGVRVMSYPAAPEGASPAAFAIEYAWAWLCTTACLLRVLVAPGFDILQIAGNPDIFFPVSAVLRGLGRRVVFDQRDLAPETYVARYGKRDRIYRTLLWLERRSYRAADHVLVVNESLRQVALTRGEMPSAAVTVVGNGPRLASVEEAVPNEDLKRGHDLLAVWLGVIGPQDHLDLALRAFADVVRGQLFSCHLAVIGDGESRPAAQALVADLDIVPHVTFTGWLSQEATFEYLATADLGLDSNLDDFVSPVKVMEYMAFGVAIAAFDLFETRLLADGAAQLVPPGNVAALADAMGRLLSDPGLRAELGWRGRQHVRQRVSWHRQEERYLAVYRSLAAER